MRRLGFYDHHRMDWHEANWKNSQQHSANIGEFMIGEYGRNLGAGVGKGGEFKVRIYRFNPGFNSTTIDVQFCVFTDGLLSFRTLEKMRVVEAIRRASLKDKDDLARLLIRSGVRDLSDKPLEDR